MKCTRQYSHYVLAVMCVMGSICFLWGLQHEAFAAVTDQVADHRFQEVAGPVADVVMHDPVLLRKIIHTIAIVVFCYSLIFLLVRLTNKHVENIKLRHSMRKKIAYAVNLFAGVYIISLWIHSLSTMTIFFSAIGAGLVIVLQEPLLSIAGWLLILIRHPFAIGDRIELGGIQGDVIDIRLFQTTMLEIGNWVDGDQSTGRLVNVPNSAVFKQASYNYSRGFDFIWHELSVHITFESDYKRAEEIMLAHGKAIAEGMEQVVKSKIRHMSQRYMIFYEKLTPIVYVRIKDSGVELTLRYLTETRKRRLTQDALSRAICDDFACEASIDFAYTTYR